MSPDRRPGDNEPRNTEPRNTEPRHPSYDPSGDEPAGSSDGLPDRSFAAPDAPESEREQAQRRREGR